MRLWLKAPMHAFKPTIFLLLVSTILTSCGTRGDKRAWVKYESEDGKFAVEMPAGYQVLHYVDETAFGNLMTHHVYWRNPVLFNKDFDIKHIWLQYYDLPKDVPQEKIKSILEITSKYMQGLHKPIEPFLIPAHDITMGKYTGTYFAFEEDRNKDDLHVCFVKKFVVKNRVYTMYANAYKKPMNRSQIDKFMNSLRITAL